MIPVLTVIVRFVRYSPVSNSYHDQGNEKIVSRTPRAPFSKFHVLSSVLCACNSGFLQADSPSANACAGHDAGSVR